MANYKEMYILLFNKITDIVEDLQKIHQQVEEIYISQEEPLS